MLLDRRAFLESLGLVSASSLLSCTSAPVEKLYAYLSPSEDLIPGTASFYATVCRACPAGCGLLVKTREARPIKLEGNPAHPINRGALCARGQAFIQGLYSPHRIKAPLTRNASGFSYTAWPTAVAAVVENLKSARTVGLMSGLESGALEQRFKDFAGLFSQARRVTYEPLALSSLRTACGILFARPEVPRLDLSTVDYFVSLGADILDTWVSPVELSRQWAGRHVAEEGRELHVEYVGPRRNLTATAADIWHRVSAKDVGPIALALVHDLFRKKKPSLMGQEIDAIEKVLSKLGKRPETTVLGARTEERIANRLAAAKAGTVAFGGSDVSTVLATSIHAAVLLANYLTGSLDRAWQFGENYVLSKVDSEADTLALLDRAGSDLDVLMIVDSNPVYSLPAQADVMKKLSRIPLVVALSPEHNETTSCAHVVLPTLHPLESWGDYEVTRDIRGLMQPVRAPLYDTKHAGDILADLAAGIGKPLSPSEFRRFVAERWAKQGNPWDETLVRGGEFPTSRPGATKTTLTPSAIDKLTDLGTPPSSVQTGLTLIAPASATYYDGRSAASSWLLETPDALTQTAYEIPVELSLDAAQAAGVQDGDYVVVTSRFGKITGTVLVDRDLAPQTVALRMGGGRSVFDAVGPGANVMDLMGVLLCPASGELALGQSNVSVERLEPGKLTVVSGGQDSHERNLCLSMKLNDFKRGRYPKLTRAGDEMPDAFGRVSAAVPLMPHEELPGSQPDDNIVELQEHPSHRWGMIVDLDRCIGCSACVVACQAENNIPVVGKDEVSRHRQLLWLRIEKHVFNDGKDVHFLPVMCQQCDNAPCAPVCPVFASHHTQDGLNAQVYNRCVGTRYCANNCPYKVRRFNYFKYPRPEPSNEQLNPDVTVRSRGVMEKCTFCIQRIREATNRAKSEGRTVQDGEIVPACAQTCPTGAIVFGDFKQASSRMATLARSPRGYRLLDYAVNTRPGVVYLRKVISTVEDS